MIQLKDVNKVYRVGSERVEALNNISIHIDRGEFVAIIGQSGSGKSTLLNILGCLDTPSSGAYLLEGKDMNHSSKNELASLRNEHIGFIFQNFNLLPRYSALQNVILPLVYADIPVENHHNMGMKALERVGLGNRIKHKPNELSGGQQQRVSIARALINNPSILLADEPTGNLDSKTTTDIMNLFAELHQQGHTIILITHEDDIAQKTERIITLKDGEVISDKSLKK